MTQTQLAAARVAALGQRFAYPTTMEQASRVDNGASLGRISQEPHT